MYTAVDSTSCSVKPPGLCDLELIGLNALLAYEVFRLGYPLPEIKETMLGDWHKRCSLERVLDAH